MKTESNSSEILGLVITDGVGYRNFCLSDFLVEASKGYERVIIYSGLPTSVYNLEEFKNIKVVELPVFVEPFKTWFWRKFKEVAHLQLHKKFFGINDNLKSNYSDAKSNRGRATRFIFQFTKFCHSETFVQQLEKLQKKSLVNHNITKEISQILKKDRPNFLFFTHQRPPYMMPIIVAAEKLKIKTCSFIFSWDNLASKGRMASSFDRFVVWSDLMKEELLYFYPNTTSENVEVVGTPQFEPYVLPKYQMDRQEFFRKFQLSENKRIICYSCGDISTSKNDELYIQVIAEAIQNKKIKEEVNFIVRTSPAEDGSRFSKIQKSFPFIIWNFPKWHLSRENHPEEWSQRIPQEEDLHDLRGLLEYCDLSINMCSTMSLDFMIFDKPVINPVFGNEKNGLYNDQRFLQYAHYKKVAESGAVEIVKDADTLIFAINDSLQNPLKKYKEHKGILELQIGKPLQGTSKRIVEALIKFNG
ncbi:MAG TPA: hypothetical protein VFM70_12870 [Salinimicrobium sp.]|nr:hypothetical protein [Salinimicrobium sp.]